MNGIADILQILLRERALTFMETAVNLFVSIIVLLSIKLAQLQQLPQKAQQQQLQPLIHLKSHFS
jgi:glycerol-3-phosphate responsive antiterminator|tara:strand:- start:899 stop:1093 length:195 start_codon:yes stop_codon:yes gene_type:complete